MNKKKLAAVLIAGAIGGGFGFAPAALAWQGWTHYVHSSCWRTWGSSTATFGADSANITYANGGGLPKGHQTDAWLKYNGSDKDYVGSSAAGVVRIREDHGGVNGGGGWKVFARHTDSIDGSRESDSCTIT
jgi:hypothetical protein